MDSEKKLSFLHKIAKLGLDHIAHYDGGGVIGANPNQGSGGPTAGALNTAGNAATNINGGTNAATNFGTSVAAPLTGGLTGLSAALTTQNQFNAAAPTQIGTVGSQQAQLAQQLGAESAGGGPNPAQLQYQQNAQNVAQQQAALNAQNRAINPGLAARQSSNAAVSAQQQAAGTAAAQQAQQQLAAQQEMAGLTGQEQQGALAAQNINAQVAQNNTNAVNNTEGGLFSSIGSIASLFAEGGEVKKMAYGGGAGSIADPGGPNLSNVNSMPDYSSGLMGNSGKSKSGSSASAPSVNGGLGANPFGISGVSNQAVIPPMSAPPILGSSAGIGSPAAPPSLNPTYAHGGGVHMHSGGHLGAPMEKHYDDGGPVSAAGKWLNMAKGGKSQKAKADVPAMVSPGEELLDPEQAKAVADGKANPLKIGERVPGKAKVKGDSLKNDTVPKMLKDGGMVIPRSIVKMHPEKAAEFVRNHLSKKGMGLK
jgi:hypothetical protein